MERLEPHIEDMDMPCPLDICNGSGVIIRDDGFGDEYDELCPHTFD